MAALLLVLFPLFFIVDTRLGAAMLVLAVVLLYRGGAARRVKQARTEAARPQAAWKDPWGEGGSGA